MTKLRIRAAAAAACLLALHAGATHAQQRLALPARDAVVSVAASTLYRIGVVDGEEWETFGNITGVAFDAAGSLYVLDTANHRVHVFDTRGRHVRSFGRRGGGPGELTVPIGLAIDRDGDVIINDAARGALQVLSPTGEYLRSVPLAGVIAGGRMRGSAAGGVVMQTEQLQASDSPGELEQGRPRYITWFSFGEPATRQLYVAPAQPRHQQAVGEGLFAFMPPALAARLHWAVLPDGGLVATDAETYRLTIVAPSGAQQRVIERPLTPRRVTEQDRRRYLEAQRRAQPVLVPQSTTPGGRPVPVQGPLPAPAPTVFAERMQVVQGLVADMDGRIWVARGDREGAALTDIVTADGRYIGTARDLELPTAFGPDGLAAWIERDDLDVQRVVVRRVQLPR